MRTSRACARQHTEASRVQDEIAARFDRAGTSGAILVRAATLEEALQESERIAARLGVYREEDLIHGTRSVTALLPSERTQRERLALFNALPREAVVRDLRLALEKQGFVAGQFEAFFADFARPHDAVVRWGDPALQPVSRAYSGVSCVSAAGAGRSRRMSSRRPT